MQFVRRNKHQTVWRNYEAQIILKKSYKQEECKEFFCVCERLRECKETSLIVMSLRE